MRRFPFRHNIFNFLNNYWPVILFVLLDAFIFRKVLFFHLIPFPGDLLVSWFFPYNSGGWTGYSPWTTHKEFILADVVRMMYPWRMLSMDLLKHGSIPLWNIYSFAGNPLLANLQSAVFYPLNILFLVINPQWAWITYIMSQPVLATFFMYLFIRSIGLSRVASIFAGIGFAFIGYTDVWFEMGIVGHAALWLPFILWGMTKFMNTGKTLFLVLSAIGTSCSFLAGHPQTTAYVLIFSFAYFLYIGSKKLPRSKLVKGLFLLFLGITLCAIQIVPTYELLSHAVQDRTAASVRFHHYIIPPSHIAMLFAPDFFGNPATNNFWGTDYGEFMSYSGIVVLLMAVIGFYTQFTHKIVRLSSVVAVIAFLVTFVPPISELLFRSPIPLLNSELPSRTMFLASVSFVLVSAYGIEAVHTMKLQKIIPPVLFFLSLYIVLWILVFTLPIDPTKLTVTKHNIILPTIIVFVAGITILGRKYTKYAFILWVILFVCMGIEYSYFLNKYLPWSTTQYIFPQHPLIAKLQQLSENDRIYGYDRASITSNLMVQWRLQSPEGYDPLHIDKYAELLSAGQTGNTKANPPRSDALLSPSLPAQDTYSKQVLLNLLDVRYLLDKDDTAPSYWDPRTDRFPADRFKLIYQNYKWKIYENKKAFPRALVFYDYSVVSQKDKAIKTLFDPLFPYQQKLIVSSAPSFLPNPIHATEAKITKYAADDIAVLTDTKKEGLLFLADNYYPGWYATVDGKPVPILQADYSFRAVEVPEGKHFVTFSYRPVSFYLGALISLISLIMLVFAAKKKII